MAEQSYLWDTNGLGHGATTYTEAQWAKLWRAVAGNGVIAGHLNSLRLTTAANSFTVDAGGACVDGFVYVNDGTVTQSVPSSAAGTTRIDRLILRANWSAQTVTVNRIAGTDSGTPTIPGIQTSSGTTYDLPLYYFTINESGAISNVVDQRWPTPGTTGLVYQRQGGSPTIWSVPGTTSYATVGVVRQLAGSVDVSLSGAASAQVLITYPTAFSGDPIIQVTPFSVGGTIQIIGMVRNIGATSCTVRVQTWDNVAATTQVYLLWTAIGPA